VPLDALILDFGEVLVRPQSAASIERMAQLAQLEIDDFRQRYWLHRRDYDSGVLDDEQYWRRVVEGSPLPPDQLSATLEALMTADFLSWNDARESVWEIAAAFKAAGGRTAILSNGVPAVMNRVRAARPLADCFDAVIVSFEVGCAKPEQRIYEICLEKLGVPAASALFVDDRLENLVAAEQLGIRTLHFTGDESVAALREAALKGILRAGRR
jgi:putative hydrolase of the HAD superfamily